MIYVKYGVLGVLGYSQWVKVCFLTIEPMGCLHLAYLLLQRHLCLSAQITGSDNRVPSHCTEYKSQTFICADPTVTLLIAHLIPTIIIITSISQF